MAARSLLAAVEQLPSTARRRRLAIETPLPAAPDGIVENVLTAAAPGV
jgi:hypothetical protein